MTTPATTPADGELLPCANCDGEALMVDGTNLTPNHGAFVYCKACEMTTPIEESPAKAAEKWNRRATPSPGKAPEPVAWITREQLEAVRDESSDAWVYWCEPGHIAEPDEIPLYASPGKEEAERDAARYQFIKKSRLILSGGNTKFGWPISPYGDQCDKYLDAAMLAAAEAPNAEKGEPQRVTEK